ncbi:ABC transporter permease [Paenibacillus paeoniae]|uniref:Iron export ABC transporter permease subunit FetB n=1 Tax=Paenibacillus paeoniae TaxID=2292705 RepID=A0A371PHF2_9BACL|nr:iron export ABC transporter permease subunit FetB [Paenibacillus paeoniae]REK75652.1 iron export ABC transporter permease subunit FetB [Paenibacillus paeoniae]
MTLLALSCTLIFVFITMFVSFWKKIGLEKSIAIGSIRAAVQLLAIGYVLQYIFKTESLAFILIIVLIMIAVASWNASKRGDGLKGVFWRIALTIVAMEAFMMLFLIGLKLIEPTPQYIIPLSGMTIGNAMIVAGLFTTAVKREVETSRGEIETLLSLGASGVQALQGPMKRAVKFSMIPTIDSLKTVGLVQLPGMMTGMIIAGADPVEAVRYQLLILFSHTGSAAMTSMILSMLYQKLLFTPDLRLRKIGRS